MPFRDITKDSAVAVIGHGSWATAIVKILLENNNNVNWYVRNPEVAEHISVHRTNSKYLSQVHFYTNRLNVLTDIDVAVTKSDIVILATPSAFIKSVLSDMTASLSEKMVVSAIKGIVPDEYLTVAEYVNQVYGLPFDQIGIITGPCHAEEVALERLSYLTIACKNECSAQALGERFVTPYTKVSTSNDIYGVEYSSVLKNIYAIAVGMCHALGYGDNFMAVLISNAAIENDRFLQTTYPSTRNTSYSAYLGDLLVTCYSQFSRNRSFGIMIGKGYSVKNAQIEMNMVAEGYYATACVHYINQKWGVDMPIAEAMYQILYNNKNAGLEIKRILDRLV